MPDQNTADIIRIARESAGPQTPPDPEEGGIAYAVVPAGCSLQSLEAYQFVTAPRTLKANVSLSTIESFGQYFRAFRDEDSRVFADVDKRTLTAVIDYHKPGQARWREHVVKLVCKLSPEWETWRGSSGSKMDQATFAEFIEDNAPDIVSPEAAAMIEIARDMKATSDMQFASQIRLSSGRIQFAYQDNIKATVGTSNTEVPEEFRIEIPIFHGHQRRALKARLRYRVKDGKLTFWYDLWRPDAVLQDAFDHVVLEVVRTSETEVLIGEAH